MQNHPCNTSPLEDSLSGSISLNASSSNENMTSSSFIFTDIFLTISEMFTTLTSRDTSMENTWETSLSVTMFSVFTSEVSKTLSTSSFPLESSAISQIGYTQSTQTTQGSQTISFVSSITDTIKTVTSATSFQPSGYLRSDSVFRDTSSIGEVMTFTPVPPLDSHTTQVTATTTEIWTAPTSSNTTRVISGSTLFYIIRTIPQTTSVVSTLGGSEGQSTSFVISTSPD